MATVILTPHFDDAVLSCWQVLEAGEEVVVVNVFTASPAAGRPLAWWDRLTGARDSFARMAERRAEDRAALALAGREALAPRSSLYAPAAMDEHRDHVLVRDAALSLAGEGWPLVLYADLPHAITSGWPSWVTGERKRPGADPDAIWDRALAAAGLDVQRVGARVRPLEPAVRARKLAAVDCYRTQRDALDKYAFAPLADPRALAWEVYWQVPPSPLRGSHQPFRQDPVLDALGQASHHGR